MSGILYVVGTPIGNLGDMSPRAVETLQNVDFLAVEDTRVTVKLLNHFGIKKSMVSYFEHNKYERGTMICQRILNGENCAIVTDAGMPCISDPGEMLVRQCYENNITVAVVPGASAVVSALAISGLPTARFTFEGFLSVDKKERRQHLEEVRNEKRTMLFYEAPHKLNTTLKDMLATFGNRNIAIVRELTKIHEEVIRTTLEKAVNDYAENPLKGEIVLVIAGAEKESTSDSYTVEQAVTMAIAVARKENISLSEACKSVAKLTGIKKSLIYKKTVERDDSDELS